MRLRCAALIIACLTLAMVIVGGGAQAAGVVTSDQGCTQRTSSASLNQAGLVVTFGDGRTLTYCIEFNEGEDTITGLELLRRSRLQLVTTPAGGVCSIAGEGCDDPGDCFCKCKGGGSCAYWVYYQYKDGAWLYSPVGAGGRTVRNGDADGWAWGSGSSNKPNADDPTCATPVSTPTPVPTPTSQFTATPRPSATPTPRGPSPTIAALPTPAGADPPTPGTPPPSTQPAASLPLAPTVAVLSERRTPAASATPGGRASATATAIAASAPTTPSGVIRVSPEEGERNLSARADDGSSNWLSLASFGIVAAALAGLAAVLFWRRRAGI